MTYEEAKVSKNLSALKGYVLSAVLGWVEVSPESLTAFVFRLLKHLKSADELVEFYDEEILSGPHIEDDVKAFVEYSNAVNEVKVSEEDVKFSILKPSTEKIQ